MWSSQCAGRAMCLVIWTTIHGEPRNASGVALEPVDAQVVASDQFRQFLSHTPGAGLALERIIVARTRDSDRRRVEIGSHDTLGRVALRLLELAQLSGESRDGTVRISVPLTQDDLAAWVVASREGVAERAPRRCDRRELIVTARREITIVDIEGLRDVTRPPSG